MKDFKKYYLLAVEDKDNDFEIRTDRLETLNELEQFLTEVAEDTKTDVIEIETWLKYRIKELKNLDICDIKVEELIDFEDDEETAETKEILIQFEIGVLNTDKNFHYDFGYWTYEKRISLN